ncbi:DNA topoisomerase 2 [Lobulomyces angularis]|nr:DNA topoisomerase 2 [Lobulomyces angularis]
MQNSIFRENLFKNKVTLITGGGTGIGRVTAFELCALGGSVIIAGRRKELLLKTKDEFQKLSLPGTIEVVVMNIRDKLSVDNGIIEILKKYKKIDCLVNNAGGQFASPAANISEKGWKAVIDTNLNGTWIVTRAVYDKYMQENGGCIVNVIAEVSILTIKQMFQGFPMMSHTGAARAAVENLSKSLAVEWGSSKIRINNVAPGKIIGNGVNNYPKHIQKEFFLSSWENPSGRLGTESEVASAIVYLLSPAASYITGATLRVDGGSSLAKGVLPGIFNENIKFSAYNTLPAEINAELKGELKVVWDSYFEGEQKENQNKILKSNLKKTQLEHILLRPDTYIGSIEAQDALMWIEKDGMLSQKNISFCPGLYKIFDEILSNASDNKIRDPSMTTIKVTIDDFKISVYNDGKGIPIQIHKDHQIYVPEMIFANLLTSSNYDDNDKKIVGGRNVINVINIKGYGAKLCNIFSKKFIVETSSEEDQLQFKQVFKDNMSKKDEPILKKNDGKDFTKITFYPDLKRFNLKLMDEDFCSVLSKRVYDIAGTTRGVKVYLNGKLIKIKSFLDYVKLYIKSSEAENSVEERDGNKRFFSTQKNERWEVICVQSDGQFQQVSFVNSICTIKGGTHVNYVVDQITSSLLESMKKQTKDLAAIKPFNIKSQLWIFVNSLIENPSFDSQTKETMTLKPSKFGSTINISEDFVKKLIQKTNIVTNLMQLVKNKEEKLMKKTDGTKRSRLSGISKLDDANLAGTKMAKDCTLILTEGDSAKALAVCGLSVVGRDKFGVFPLRGKMLNVRDANTEKIMNNEEISNIKKILGLQHKKVYNSVESLRYGHVMIMTDQDHDGSHIKGLILNLFDHFWPSLLKIPGFILQFITPIVKVTKKGASTNNREISFFTITEYENWRERNITTINSWNIKYYKGLGTSTSSDAKKYFQNMERHVRPFESLAEDDRNCLEMAFGKKKANERKVWLENYQAGIYLNNLAEEIKVKDFVNKELILHSMADNVRSIPNVLDGLKPGQRKILFSCFKRNLFKGELKVAQLAGYVSEHSAYHHGETSLAQTMINLAFTHVGSNNINLLEPLGQFGTRLQGGKDHAAPRYIFTRLSTLARKIFNPSDNNILNYKNEEGLNIEPDFYVPILPMVLINGSDGIGTGWSTFTFNYNPKEIVENLLRKLNGEEFVSMKPWYRGFTGNIEDLGGGKYTTTGVYEVKNETTLEITELPIGTWTQSYKEFLEELVQGSEKSPAFIKDYKEYHTETKVHFVISMAAENLKNLQEEPQGIIKKFKLQNLKSLTNMVLFDKDEKLKKFSSVFEILQDYFEFRLNFYKKRKQFLEKTLADELLKLENKCRFLGEIINGKLKLENKKKDIIIEMLQKAKYVEFRSKLNGDEIAQSDENIENENEESKSGNYNYLLSMPIWSITHEKFEKLLKEKEIKKKELETLQSLSESTIWQNELRDFLQEWEEQEAEIKNPNSVVMKKSRGLNLNLRKRKKQDAFSDDDFESKSEIKFNVKKPRYSETVEAVENLTKKKPLTENKAPAKNSTIDKFFKKKEKNAVQTINDSESAEDKNSESDYEKMDIELEKNSKNTNFFLKLIKTDYSILKVEMPSNKRTSSRRASTLKAMKKISEQNLMTDFQNNADENETIMSDNNVNEIIKNASDEDDVSTEDESDSQKNAKKDFTIKKEPKPKSKRVRRFLVPTGENLDFSSEDAEQSPFFKPLSRSAVEKLKNNEADDQKMKTIKKEEEADVTENKQLNTSNKKKKTTIDDFFGNSENVGTKSRNLRRSVDKNKKIYKASDSDESNVEGELKIFTPKKIAKEHSSDSDSDFAGKKITKLDKDKSYNNKTRVSTRRSSKQIKNVLNCTESEEYDSVGMEDNVAVDKNNLDEELSDKEFHHSPKKLLTKDCNEEIKTKKLNDDSDSILVFFTFKLVLDVRHFFQNFNQQEFLKSKSLHDYMFGGLRGIITQFVGENGQTYRLMVDVSWDFEFSAINNIITYTNYPFSQYYQKFVVDIGGFDGLLASDSYNFFFLGWSGVIIEPFSESFNLIVANLKKFISRGQNIHMVKAAIGSEEGETLLYINTINPTENSLKRTRVDEKSSLTEKVQVRPIVNVLREKNVPKNFGVLSIDIEGYSPVQVMEDVLNGGYQPAFIIIEDGGNPPNGYELVIGDFRYNKIYKRIHHDS